MQTICVCFRPRHQARTRASRLLRFLTLTLALTLAPALPLPASAAAPSELPPPSTPNRPVRVLTSFLPVFSLTHGVAGTRAIVENWLPAGVDPHEFQFQPRDLRRLKGADLLILGGLGLESWQETRLRTASGNPSLRLIEAIPSLPPDLLIQGQPQDPEHDHDHGPGTDDHHGHSHEGGPNPHFWHDPLLGAWAVTNICRALSDVDPAGRDLYERQARDTVRRLELLHQEFAETLAPYRGSPFVSYHDAFPYLARRYGLRLVGVVESSAAEEATPRKLSELAAAARKAGARVLFVDGTPTRLARRLASDLGLEIAALETLETGRLEASAYEAGMRRNLAALVKAFRRAADAPTR